MSIVLDVVRSNLPIDTKQTPSGWLTINCPCCIHFGQARPDRRHRGGVMFTPTEASFIIVLIVITRLVGNIQIDFLINLKNY